MLHMSRLKWLLKIISISRLNFDCYAEPGNPTPSTAISSTNATSTATCPSTSVNYITHGLPQQCLRTTQSSPQHSIGFSTDSHVNTTTSLFHNVTGTVSVIESTTVSTSTTTRASSEITEDGLTISTSNPTGLTSDTANSDKLSTATTALTATVVATIIPEAEVEADSPLDNAHFLSFEEWKKENLAQVGQSADGLGQGRRLTGSAQDRKELGINNGLDTLGDDSEIVLDFSGFGGAKNNLGTIPDAGPAGTTSKATSESASASLKSKSKEAGKTSKERFNYASFDCAANVLKTNPRCKGSSRILSENKDSYMLNECKVDNKFIIVELCDDILVDTIVLANFEFFSSMFRTFRVSISDRYPIKVEKWRELGTFEARNSREVQAFLIENPLIWARYLKLEFLTHYGSEFYCPVSLVRVHGTTMMDEYRREELGAGDGDDEDETVDEPIAAETSSQLVTSLAEVAKFPPKIAQPEISITTEMSSSDTTATLGSMSLLISTTPSSHINGPGPTQATNTTPASLVQASEMSTSVVESSGSLPISATMSESTSTSTNVVTNASTTSRNSTATTSMVSDVTTAIQSLPSETQSIHTSSHSQPASSNTTTKTATQTSAAATSSNTTSTPSSTIHQSPSSSPPATQESFFKSINKRLHALEANATLSLQYIEAQSQLLRDAFGKVDKRQLTKMTSFLETLNATVSSELARFKLDYDQLWRSTALELAAQREEGNRERELLGERVRMLAEEMVGQKRIMVAQATALLVCAGLLIFTRVSGSNGNGGTGLIPRIQRMSEDKSATGSGFPVAKGIGKSPNVGRKRWKWDSPWMRSPAGTPRSGEVRNEEGEAEVDEEELSRVMSRLSVGTLETPTASPGVSSPANETVSDGAEEVEEDEVDQDGEEEAEQDEGEEGEAEEPENVEGRQANADVIVDSDEQGSEHVSSSSGELGKRPVVVGVQSAPTVPVLGSASPQDLDGSADGGGEVEGDG